MLEFWIDVLARAIQLVGLVTFVWAVVTYRRNARVRRAEWLSTLHAKFYEADIYKHIRHVIDYETPELAVLRESIEKGGSEDLVESFVDYLNFFEFMGSLWKLQQLSLKEIEMMFRYYLVNLTKHPFIMVFVEGQGFENLADLLTALEERRKGRP